MEERKNLMNTLQKLNLEIEQKLSSIRSLDKTLMDAPVKKNDATSIVTEIVTKAQLHWTGKVYNYNIQIKKLEQELKNDLDEKKQEEQKLDHCRSMVEETKEQNGKENANSAKTRGLGMSDGYFR